MKHVLISDLFLIRFKSRLFGVAHNAKFCQLLSTIVSFHTMENSNRRDNKSCVESLGRYEYDSKERLGFGAFAIVFKGWLKEVRVIHLFCGVIHSCHCSITLKLTLQKPSVEVAIKVIAKKNLAKSQSLLDKEIKILRVSSLEI